MSTLELREVVKHYRSGGETVRAVDGISMESGAGEFVALYGPSGSGKSSLLLLAAGLLQPDSGTIASTGATWPQSPRARAPPTACRDVGFVFQVFSSHAGRLGAGQRPDQAARAVGLHRARGAREGRALARAHGSWGEIGPPPRAALDGRAPARRDRARARGRAALLLADEPTGNLDSVAHARNLRACCATSATNATSRCCWSPTIPRRSLSSIAPSRSATGICSKARRRLDPAAPLEKSGQPQDLRQYASRCCCSCTAGACAPILCRSCWPARASRWAWRSCSACCSPTRA